ncbi:hypothetical protein DL96DRAFT_1703488 [Flagelloscypha sp. PMI_526]|nr:hypothetical protein DL96DRAFT_1703488 [Flagelloscypha sp. PMI_526]
MPAKKRCQFTETSVDQEGNSQGTQCNQAALRMVGTCPHCSHNFCGSHRMPEQHQCNNLEDCRMQAFERNKAKLESERTVSSKMAVA